MIIQRAKPLVIVGQLDIDRSFAGLDKTDPKLVVDADRILSGPVAFERLQPISGTRLQVAQQHRSIQIAKLSSSDLDKICRKAFANNSVKSILGLLVAEAFNHID